MADLERLKAPPRAPIAFRIGVVGHRPNRLPTDPATLDLLREQIATILSAAKLAAEDFKSGHEDGRFYADVDPLLRVISPLAEGSDRILAEEGLKLGFSLCCPMPFARDRFMRDFEGRHALEPDSAARFCSLLERAKQLGGLVTFELDGSRASRATEASAYAAAGRVVMNQSDLMVVVWDGKKKAGEGGTLESLHEAIRFHVPVIWIDALDPSRWKVFRAEDDLGSLEGARRCTPPPLAPGMSIEKEVFDIVHSELGLPQLPDMQAVHDEAVWHASAYFREHWWPLNPGVLWKPFRDLVGLLRLRPPDLFNRDFVEQVRETWPTSDADSGGRTISRSDHDAASAIFRANAALRAHFAWSDKLADLFADAHRSVFLFSNLMAAAAVMFALLPVAMSWTNQRGRLPDTLSVAAEFAVLAASSGFLFAAVRRRWHERWMEYRLMAELIRQLRFMLPLGGGRPLVRTPTFLGVYGDPTRSWMYWHVRAIARAAGLPSAEVDPHYVRECLEDLEAIADGPGIGQRSWHQTNSVRSNNIYRVLSVGSGMLFLATVVTTGVHFAWLAMDTKQDIRSLAEKIVTQITLPWMILLSAFLPALGNALAGINHSGEFLRSAKRSRAMADEFALQAKRIRELAARSGEPTLAEVIPIASRMAQSMVEEVIDWRAILLDRRPGAG